MAIRHRRADTGLPAVPPRRSGLETRGAGEDFQQAFAFSLAPLIIQTVDVVAHFPVVRSFDVDFNNRIDTHGVIYPPVPAAFGIEGFFYCYEKHFDYWKELASGDIGIVTVLLEHMHQIKGTFEQLCASARN